MKSPHLPGSNRPNSDRVALQSYIVTAEQMRQIEERVFAAGMPVAALMEKVGGLLVHQIRSLYPDAKTIGVLVGPGHNGGDALVVARELHLLGYDVRRYQPVSKLKDLTQAHAHYADRLDIPVVDRIEDLQDCDVLIDGLFGFGLTRSLTDHLATVVETLNNCPQPIVSLDVPSGLHTDTGAVLGTAIRATHTLCLGLWKRAFLQDQAIDYLGQAQLIDIGLPLSDIAAVLGHTPTLQRITPQQAIATLPLPRPAITHKYQQGHLLLIAGSRRYSGAALLVGLAARSSGVGMLSIAVPESFKPLMTAQLPDALIIGCPEEVTGAIDRLPLDLDLDRFDVIAAGPGLTPQAKSVIQHILERDRPLILDADGLNVLAELGTISTLQSRTATTVLTPHLGEFKRLFPMIDPTDRLTAAQTAAQHSGAIVLLKGSRTAIGTPQGRVWLNPESTPALARGGSGDVLTGLIGGLFAQDMHRPAAGNAQNAHDAIVASAVWWHAQAGILAAQERSELGVDALTLAQYLIPVLQGWMRSV